ALDKDKDGRISKAEASNTPLAEIFDRIDQTDPATKKKDQFLSREEIQAYLIKFEPGRDGILTEEELTQYYLARYPGRDGLLTPDKVRSYYGGDRNRDGDAPRRTPTLDGEVLYAAGGAGDRCRPEVAPATPLPQAH